MDVDIDQSGQANGAVSGHAVHLGLHERNAADTSQGLKENEEVYIFFYQCLLLGVKRSKSQ